MTGCLQEVFQVSTRKHQVAKYERRRVLPKRSRPLWRMRNDSLEAVTTAKWVLRIGNSCVSLATCSFHAAC